MEAERQQAQRTRLRTKERPMIDCLVMIAVLGVIYAAVLFVVAWRMGKPKCIRCGACCEHQGSPPSYLLIDADNPEMLDPRDVERYETAPQEAKDLLQEYVRKLRVKAIESDGPCVWLDPKTKLCRFYEHRPQVCRDFPAGGPGCQSWREQYR